jgi:hypothetical protein
LAAFPSYPPNRQGRARTSDCCVIQRRALHELCEESLERWTWKPQVWEGGPTAVKTTVWVGFNCGSPGFGSPQSIVDTDSSPSPVKIVLKSGRTIHADTVSKDANTVSYTVDEQVYQIPNTMVQQIISQDAPATIVADMASAAAPNPQPQQPLTHQLPFSSLADLRQQCESRSCKNADHPELATAGDVYGVLQATMGSFMRERSIARSSLSRPFVRRAQAR